MIDMYQIISKYLAGESSEAEEQLMEKMERWEYLEELAEKIANQ